MRCTRQGTDILFDQRTQRLLVHITRNEKGEIARIAVEFSINRLQLLQRDAVDVVVHEIRPARRTAVHRLIDLLSVTERRVGGPIPIGVPQLFHNHPERLPVEPGLGKIEIDELQKRLHVFRRGGAGEAVLIGSGPGPASDRLAGELFAQQGGIRLRHARLADIVIQHLCGKHLLVGEQRPTAGNTGIQAHLVGHEIRRFHDDTHAVAECPDRRAERPLRRPLHAGALQPRTLRKQRCHDGFGRSPFQLGAAYLRQGRLQLPDGREARRPFRRIGDKHLILIGELSFHIIVEFLERQRCDSSHIRFIFGPRIHRRAVIQKIVTVNGREILVETVVAAVENTLHHPFVIGFHHAELRFSKSVPGDPLHFGIQFGHRLQQLPLLDIHRQPHHIGNETGDRVACHISRHERGAGPHGEFRQTQVHRIHHHTVTQGVQVPLPRIAGLERPQRTLVIERERGHGRFGVGKEAHDRLRIVGQRYPPLRLGVLLGRNVGHDGPHLRLHLVHVEIAHHDDGL